MRGKYMKKIDNFVNLYPVTKTLKFKLIPVGKTKKNFDKNKLLETDKERADNYYKAKVIIDLTICTSYIFNLIP